MLTDMSRLTLDILSNLVGSPSDGKEKGLGPNVGFINYDFSNYSFRTQMSHDHRDVMLC